MGKKSSYQWKKNCLSRSSTIHTYGGSVYGVSPQEVRRIDYEHVAINNIKNSLSKQIKITGKEWFYTFLRNFTINCEEVGNWNQ